MAKVTNAKVVLADGRDFDYAEADLTVEPSGVVKVVSGDVAYYAPSAWSMVSHDPLPEKKPQPARRLR